MAKLLSGILLLLAMNLVICGCTRADDDTWVSMDASGEAQIRLYFFWSSGCPHCLEARPFMEKLGNRYPWLELQSLEVGTHHSHLQLYRQLAATLGEKANSVPAFLFCGTMATGFATDATTGTALEKSLVSCHRLVQERGPQGWRTFTQRQEDEPVQLPVLGELDLSSLSLPAFTLVLAGLDSFNPCAFFVLLFLLSLLVHARSRGHMLLIGGTFVFFSGLLYFIFMSAWLNLFLVAGELAWVTTLAGLVSVTIALINIRQQAIPLENALADQLFC